MTALRDIQDRLIHSLAASERGPLRNALFALWLTVKACEDFLPPEPASPRIRRKHMEALSKRITSLSMPPDFKRCLGNSLKLIADADPTDVPALIGRLAAPAEETMGREIGSLLTRATSVLREMSPDSTDHAAG